MVSGTRLISMERDAKTALLPVSHCGSKLQACPCRPHCQAQPIDPFTRLIPMTPESRPTPTPRQQDWSCKLRYLECLPADPGTRPAYPGTPEESQPVHSTNQPGQRLSRLTGDGLSLPKPACKDWKRYLHLQMHNYQTKARRITNKQENHNPPTQGTK